MSESVPPRTWTQDDLNRLKDAIAKSGSVLSVTYAGGETVRYRSIKEMLEVYNIMNSEVSAVETPAAPSDVRAIRGFVRNCW